MSGMKDGIRGTLVTNGRRRPAVVVAITSTMYLVDGCKGLGGSYWLKLRDDKPIPGEYREEVTFIPKVKRTERRQK